MAGARAKFRKTALLTTITLWGCQSTAQVTRSADAASPAATPSQAPAPPATQRPMMGGWHHRSPYGQLYFQGKKVSIEGEIVKSAPVMPLPQMMQGIQFILKTREGEKTIHLGPSWFINQQEFTLIPGEKVRVDGRSVVVAGETIVMASSVQKGNESLQLRDENGFPYWAGGRSRQLP